MKTDLPVLATASAGEEVERYEQAVNSPLKLLKSVDTAGKRESGKGEH